MGRLSALPTTPPRPNSNNADSDLGRFGPPRRPTNVDRPPRRDELFGLEKDVEHSPDDTGPVPVVRIPPTPAPHATGMPIVSAAHTSPTVDAPFSAVPPNTGLSAPGHSYPGLGSSRPSAPGLGSPGPATAPAEPVSNAGAPAVAPPRVPAPIGAPTGLSTPGRMPVPATSAPPMQRPPQPAAAPGVHIQAEPAELPKFRTPSDPPSLVTPPGRSADRPSVARAEPAQPPLARLEQAQRQAARQVYADPSPTNYASPSPRSTTVGPAARPAPEPRHP